MIVNQLSKYIDTYDAIKKRGSGIKTNDLRMMEQLGLVKLVKLPLKSGKSPKSYNGFEITLMGRDFIRNYLNQTISRSEILAKVNHDLKEVLEDMKSVHRRLEKIEQKHHMMNQLLSSYQKSSKLEKQNTMKDITQTELIKLLQLAEDRAKRSDTKGPMYSTEIYFKILEENTPFRIDTISHRLYELYELNKLDLQMGPDHAGRSVDTPSGKSFSWGRLMK